MSLSEKQRKLLQERLGAREDRGTEALESMSQRDLAIFTGIYEVAKDSGFEVVPRQGSISIFEIVRTGKPGKLPADLAGGFTSTKEAVTAIEKYLEGGGNE